MLFDRQYIEHPNGHVWRLDEDGEVDCCAVDYEFHNGPICTVCWFSFCEHCHTGELKPCPGKKS